MNKEDMKALIEDFLGDWCKTLRHEILCNLDKIGSDISLLPNSELLVDTPYANETKSVRLMDKEGFTRTFKERKTGKWKIDYDCFHSDPMDNPCYCSICKRRFHQSFDSFPYCPICGSEMKGGN